MPRYISSRVPPSEPLAPHYVAAMTRDQARVQRLADIDRMILARELSLTRIRHQLDNGTSMVGRQALQTAITCATSSLRRLVERRARIIQTEL
jgi:hypothetical protein